MSAILERISDGSRLVVDAVPDAEVSPSWRVTEHPVESTGGALGTIVDHVQRLATTVQVRAVFTERPPDTVADRGGPDRIREVLAWFEASGGELLNVMFPHRPTLRNLVIEGAPYTIGVVEGTEVRVSLREVRFAESMAVQIGQRPRADVAAGSNKRKDTGQTAPEQADRSIAKFLKDTLRGLGGGG